MIIALKGYMGTGKTTISKLICNKYNYKTINADEIVRQIYDTDKELKKKVIETFNLQEFDKKELAQIVFKDKEKLKELEAIIHPILKSEMLKQIEKSTSNILLDCQIIDKLDIKYDYEILLIASKQTIINRIKKRDNKDEQLITKILDEQEKYNIQKAKTFPINTEKKEEEIEKDLEKIINIFIKEQEYKKYEEEFDEDDW